MTDRRSFRCRRAPRLWLAGLLAVAALVLTAAVPLSSSASPDGHLFTVRARIDAARAKIGAKRGTEQVLTTTISGFTQRIDALQGSITHLQTREDAIQADLDVKRDELVLVQSELQTARLRLARLRARLAFARRTLARRLVQLYETPQPDMVSVVLDSHGFTDLLDNGTFLHAIGRQDRRIVTAVAVAKTQATATTRRLSSLQVREQQVAATILARRDQVDVVRLALARRRASYSRARAAKQHALDSVRASRRELQQHVDFLQSAERRIEARIQAAQGPAVGAAMGPVRSGGGVLIWPVNGPITSPFCERRAWEACHPGIDIGVPSGTPIHAAASGTVTIADPVSGYGNYTCIQHAGPLSTCYGHQSSIGVSIGQHVTQGQVIGLSGCTGLCFGPHVHFETRINGSVVNPMNYL